MLFYEIELNTMPKIKYNRAVVATGYRASLGELKGLFELCYVESGEFVCQNKSDALICEAGHLYPMFFDKECEIYSENSAPTKIHAVGIECDFSLKVIDSGALSEDGMRSLMRELLSGNRFLLPKEGLSSYQCDWLLPYVKKLGACNPNERIAEEARALSILLEMMSRITRASMDEVAYEVKSFPTSAIAYSEMVVFYIIKNYRKKISVIDIAEEFGLTPNYLHAIFKQVKGMTIIEYLTNYRMEIAKTYIERFGLRAYEAADMVGIDDPAYFSRVFKKLYGKSVSEYKKGK